MRNHRFAWVLGLCALMGRAQTAKNDATLLDQARAAYDTPFNRGLQSFECAIDFSWKQHFTETLRVGDEGTDEELENTFQPIRNRVTVTREDALVLSGMTEEQEHQLPHGGMAEGLLKHAVRFSLRTWLVASNNGLLPPAGTPVHVESSGSGYRLGLKMQDVDIAMMLTRDMRLQNMSVKGSDSDRQDFEFLPGPQGLLLSSWTMGEDGNYTPGNRLIFTFTYKTVSGIQLPERVVVNRESHHEIWRYKLSDCNVKISK